MAGFEFLRVDFDQGDLVREFPRILREDFGYDFHDNTILDQSREQVKQKRRVTREGGVYLVKPPRKKSSCQTRDERSKLIITNLMPHGVMVAQLTLDQFDKVRILVRQPPFPPVAPIGSRGSFFVAISVFLY